MPVIRILHELLSRLEDAEKYLVLLITPVALSTMKTSVSSRLCNESFFLLKNSQIDCPRRCDMWYYQALDKTHFNALFFWADSGLNGPVMEPGTHL